MADDVRAERRRSFGRALAATRRTKGLSQEELAQRIEVSQSNVSAWESGRWGPEPTQVFELERALGIAAGTLSHHLGFGAIAADVAPCSVERAVLEDDLLDDLDKRALLGMYRELASRRSSS